MSGPLFHIIAGAPDGWVFVTGQMPFSGTAKNSPYLEGTEAQIDFIARRPA